MARGPALGWEQALFCGARDFGIRRVEWNASRSKALVAAPSYEV
jgi:hypothetical protein